MQKDRYYVLFFFALLAGSGLRIGEALAVKDTSFSPDCRIVYVPQVFEGGKGEQTPKTTFCVREIDIPEPLAACLLREYVAGESQVIYSQTASGRPLVARETYSERYTQQERKWGFMLSPPIQKQRHFSPAAVFSPRP
jgi:hypothetical protein